MSKIVITDTTWLVHRSLSVSADRSSYPEMSTAVTVLGWICDYAMRFNASHVAAAFEGGNCFRYRVYNDYKGAITKEVDEQSIKDRQLREKALDLTEHLLKKIGIEVIRRDGYEADDVAMSCATKLEESGHRTILVTRDKDYYQVVSDRITVFHPKVGKNSPEILVTPDEVLNIKGLRPDQMVDLQTLIGDGVDHIPSIVSLKEAKRILSKDSLEKWCKFTPEGQKFWKANRSELVRNRQLVKAALDSYEPDMNKMALRFNKDFWDKAAEREYKLPYKEMNYSIPSSARELFSALKKTSSMKKLF